MVVVNLVVPPRIERGSKVPETFVVSILLRDHEKEPKYWGAKIMQRGGQFGRPFEIMVEWVIMQHFSKSGRRVRQ